MGDFPNEETQFKPGQSGNPNGRPKGSLSVKSIIEKIWNEEIKDAKGNVQIEGILAVKAIFDKAKDGDVNAFRALVERMEGMPKQEIDMNANITKMDKIVKDGKVVDFDIGTSAPPGSTGEAA